jgi:MFS family permease
VLLTLILWGAATDRRGERVILVTGLVVAVAGALASLAATGYPALAPALAIPLVPKDIGYLPKNGVSIDRESPISGK